MIHDPALLDRLSSLEVEVFCGEVFRATRNNLDPLASSTNGGRWMPKGESNVLYTSLSRNGALAELTFHWGMLNPLPSKPAAVSRIKVDISSCLRILRTNFESLGVSESEYGKLNYEKMQKIGAVVAFLDCHGLVVPSARWSCENLIIFTENLSNLDALELLEMNEIDWQRWGRENDLLE